MKSLVVAFVLVVAARSGAAQAKCLEQVKFPPVGRWAQYQAVYKEDPYTLRYAVIGVEPRGGKRLQWVEMRMKGKKPNQNVIYQMLVPGSLMEMSQVQEIVFKPAGKPALKMSGPMLSMIRGELEKQSFYGDMCKGVTLVGREKVAVPAGSFQALHFRSEEHASDSWISSSIPFSLVKSTGKDYKVELIALGSGAKSSITENPKEMPGLGAAPGR
jgi:hypothetical protein